MLLEEFERLQPRLAGALKVFAGRHSIDGVYQQPDGRWEAHCSIGPNGDFEICLEARCKPNCLSGGGYRRVWIWEGHQCCEACEQDPSHRYQSVHE